jgi:hypothetical protein
MSSLFYGLLGGIGGLTFAPGLYKWTTGVNIASDITISGTSLDSTHHH